MTQMAHAIDYSSPALKGDGAKACQNEIVRFVAGIRRPRRTPVTTKQILQWFRATPQEFVHTQLDATLIAGRIRAVPRSLKSTRRHNGVCVYEVTT